jgi:hypothetical protein
MEWNGVVRKRREFSKHSSHKANVYVMAWVEWRDVQFFRTTPLEFRALITSSHALWWTMCGPSEGLLPTPLSGSCIWYILKWLRTATDVPWTNHDTKESRRYLTVRVKKLSNTRTPLGRQLKRHLCPWRDDQNSWTTRNQHASGGRL